MDLEGHVLLGGSAEVTGRAHSAFRWSILCHSMTDRAHRSVFPGTDLHPQTAGKTSKRQTFLSTVHSLVHFFASKTGCHILCPPQAVVPHRETGMEHSKHPTMSVVLLAAWQECQKFCCTLCKSKHVGDTFYKQ